METSERPTDSRYAGRHRIVDHTTPSVPGYDVVEPIGQGGSGAVWSATDAAGATVAIKVVPAVDAADALVELAVLGRITDPHLVRLHEATALPNGDVALVLDHLAGGTLGSAVRARGHLAPGEAVTVLSPIASTLGRLHGIGVVHGDVSPDNVLLDLEGRPFLADLGVASIVGEQLAELRGTEGFVAPEVAVGGAPSPASDAYALGALAWFVLTGEAPGPAVIRGRLGERVSGLPVDLVAAVEGALRSRAEDRPNADALAVAIFESADPEPLVLVTGGDDVSLLTRRIRAAARASSHGGAAATSAPGPGRARDLARRCLSTTSTGRKVAASGLRSLRAVAPFVMVLGVMAAVALGVVAWSGGRDDARASTGSPSALASATPSNGPAAASGASDARLGKDAPRADPLGLVSALARARAEAWSTGIAARLVEVDAPRSPALARDTEVLAGVQRANQRYVGLTFTVREAAFEGESRGVATVRARIDTGAHVVRGPGGDQRRPAVAGPPVLLDLVRTDSGWRVQEVRAV
ncbi:probable serine/threonine-protein kinase transcriptional regulatoryprotein pknk (protein kinase k) (stpk k) [Janibacter sp. HTCC2649]|uniref:serine/threonine-protein kinase n=1 Tax=Janibacter sp. HTCC2649 TaxID=313589 RepID=UPI000066ED1F|nr:serine/threonine-protein kinase [Janibacter sp. HTCC2649]EAP98761.1 probable serine/threonine-protein kinase transcriptional regulatoryprotein pknk (protein kinase k) (stpk k) [Janibacter sp. HTCC2649]